MKQFVLLVAASVALLAVASAEPAPGAKLIKIATQTGDGFFDGKEIKSCSCVPFKKANYNLW